MIVLKELLAKSVCFITVYNTDIFGWRLKKIKIYKIISLIKRAMDLYLLLKYHIFNSKRRSSRISKVRQKQPTVRFY